MIRRPPRSTQSRSSAASDVYKRQHLLRRTQTGLAGEISARPVSSGMLVRSGTCAGLVMPGIAVAVLPLRVDKRRTWSVAIVSGWDGSTVMENNSAHVTIKDCRTQKEKVNMRGLGDSNCRPGSFREPFWVRQV